MLKVLVKKQILELFQSFFQNRKTGKARSSAGSVMAILGFAALMGVLMVGVFGGLAFMLSDLISVGFGWVYYALICAVSLVLGVFGSVFNTYASLYKAKDNDLLLSLPIPVGKIITARLLGVYLMGLMYSAAVILPGIVVYGWVSRDVKGIIGGIVMIAVLSVLVLVLSCLLGWVVAKVSTRIKSKSFATVALSLAFLGGYYYVYFKAIDGLNDILQHADTLAESIRSAGFPLYLMGMGAAGDWRYLALDVILAAALLALTCYVMARSFLRLATASDVSARRVYREKTARKASPDGALLRREMGRFFGSATYMLNAGLGTVLLSVAGVALLVKGQDVAQMLEVFSSKPDFDVMLLVIGVCTLAAMNFTSAASVSMEGKNYWIVRTMPVTTWQILRAKLRMHMVVTNAPALFCSVCAVIAVKPDFALGAMMILVPQGFALMFGALGLTLNLLSPNLNWTTENAAIKQSLAGFVCMMVGWVVAAAMFGTGMTSMDTGILLTVWLAGMGIVYQGLMLWLEKKGTAIFEKL